MSKIIAEHSRDARNSKFNALRYRIERRYVPSIATRSFYSWNAIAAYDSLAMAKWVYWWEKLGAGAWEFRLIDTQEEE